MTIAYFAQLIITIFDYVILSLVFLGIGRLLSQILKIDFLSDHKFFFLIWLGWAITLLFLQVVNLFFPINAYISILILTIGLFSAIQYFKMDFRVKLIRHLPRVFPALVATAVFWVASLSMQEPSAYDSGLYHFNFIRWLNEFPIVLGLGNLHGRLAFNQSFFAFVAFLNVYPMFNSGYNIANSYLLLILLAECIFYLSKYIAPKHQTTKISITNVTAPFFLPVIIYLGLFEYTSISSPSPDTASSILQILIFIYFIRAIDSNILDMRNAPQIIFILIMSATAITIKLSNLFFVLSICLILFLFKVKSPSILPKQPLLISAKLLILPALILIIWCLRGYLLSGCPAYPSTVWCVNTRWAVPIETVKNEADWIYSWARLPRQAPDTVLKSWGWLGPWFYRVIWENKITVVYPLSVFIAGAIINFLLVAHLSPTQKINRIWLLIPLPTLIGLFSWFYLAPDIRFAHSLFWILPISITIVILKSIEISGKLRIWVILIMFIVVNANIGFAVVNNPQAFIKISAVGNMPIPVVKLTEKTTISGLRVLSPKKGDQCWDSKIPCTPYFNPELNFKDNIVFPEFTVTNAQK